MLGSVGRGTRALAPARRGAPARRAPAQTVAAIKPPSPTYANDEAPVKMQIGEGPSIGECG